MSALEHIGARVPVKWLERLVYTALIVCALAVVAGMFDGCSARQRAARALHHQPKFE